VQVLCQVLHRHTLFVQVFVSYTVTTRGSTRPHLAKLQAHQIPLPTRQALHPLALAGPATQHAKHVPAKRNLSFCSDLGGCSGVRDTVRFSRPQRK